MVLCASSDCGQWGHASQVPAVAEVVGGPVGMVPQAMTWEAPLQDSEALKLETQQVRALRHQPIGKLPHMASAGP